MKYIVLMISAFIVATNSYKMNYRGLRAARLGSAVVGTLLTVGPMIGHAEFRLPPIDKSTPKEVRCVLSSSTIGQANAARDKLYDLRECDLRKGDASGKDLSGMMAINTDLTVVNFKEAQTSKALMKDSKFVGCDFTNAVVDRTVFSGSDLTGAIFANSVLSGTTFEGANLKDTDFTEAYLGPFDQKNLCANPTLDGTNPKTGEDTRFSAGCQAR